MGLLLAGGRRHDARVGKEDPAPISPIEKIRRRKRRLRIAGFIVLAGLALLAWGYHAANHRGAEFLRQAMAEARAAGLPLTRAEQEADMPPIERNAARHGILKEWDDAMARPMDAGADQRLASLRAFARTDWSAAWKRAPAKRRNTLSYRERKLVRMGPEAAGPPTPSRVTGSADFRQMRKSDGFREDPASFLAEFERRHGQVLERLKSDLAALPELRRPLPEVATPLAYDLVRDRLVSACHALQRALALRAEAALQTARPELAAESIALSLKLAEALGSRRPDGTSAMGSSLREISRPLKMGIARHQWRAEDLDRIAAALGALDLRRAVQRDVEAALLMLPLWERWKEDRHGFRNQGSLVFEFSDFRPIEDEFIRSGGGSILPRGWFDWNAAELLRTTQECHALALAPGPLLPWFEGAERLRMEHYPDGKKGIIRRYLLIAYPRAIDPLSRGARAIVQRDLMLAACAVEKFYVEHHTYPAALPADVPSDPLTGLSFGYALRSAEEGGGFAVYGLGPNAKDDGGPRRDMRSGSEKGDDWGW
jgi:hypothetical protein